MMLNDDVFFGNVTVAATFTGTEAREEKDVASIGKKLDALGKNWRKAPPIFALPKDKLVDTNGAGDVYTWISCPVVQEKSVAHCVQLARMPHVSSRSSQVVLPAKAGGSLCSRRS